MNNSIKEIIRLIFGKIVKLVKNVPSQKMELSFSKVRAYQECPYRYFLSYVQGWRSAPNPYSSLGHSIHKALELFHGRKGKTLEELLSAYQDGWEHEGYGDNTQAMEFYQRGEELLRAYHEKESGNKSEILFLEKKFSMDLKFCILRGIIDRIDRTPGGLIEIIEYKTHKNAWRQKAIREDIQMTIYNLACRKDLRIKPGLLSYYFLSKGKKVSTERNKIDEKRLVNLLKKTCRQIRDKNFSPNTKSCFRCDFQGRCVHVKKEQEFDRH